jgi:hypothetical protein
MSLMGAAAPWQVRVDCTDLYESYCSSDNSFRLKKGMFARIVGECSHHGDPRCITAERMLPDKDTDTDTDTDADADTATPRPHLSPFGHVSG